MRQTSRVDTAWRVVQNRNLETARFDVSLSYRAPTVVKLMRPIEPFVAVLVLNWNRHAELVECIRSLQVNDYRRMRIYVVDNGSREESIDYIRRSLTNVTIIENRRNLGFCGGFNTGISRALQDGADIVGVLNSDILVAQDFVTEVVQGFESDDIGAVSPKEYDFVRREVIRFAGGTLNPAIARLRGYGRVDNARFSQPQDTGLLCGPAMIIRADVLRSVGLFDEKLFIINEDRDLALRIRRAGFRIRFVPSARLWHKRHGGSDQQRSPISAYFGVRNYWIVAMKYGNTLQRVMAFCMLVCYWVPTTLYCGLSSHNRRYFTGLKWALLWHLDRELVPQDEEAVEILLNLA